MCSCELHDSSTALTVCSCICEEHDKFFSSDAVILRKAIRSLYDCVYALQQDMGQAKHDISAHSNALPGIYTRLRGIEDELQRVNDRLSPPEKDARLPDVGETHPDNDHWKDRAVIAERKLEYLKQAIANA